MTTYTEFHKLMAEWKTSTLKSLLAAVEKTPQLNKQTWNNCVFNAVGKQQGRSILSMPEARLIESNAERFIARWDGCYEITTSDLVEIAQELLANRVDADTALVIEYKPKKRIVRQTVFASTLVDDLVAFDESDFFAFLQECEGVMT